MKWLRFIDPRQVPEHLQSKDSLNIFRERILQSILLGMVSFGTIAGIAAVSLERQLWWQIAAYSTIYLIIMGATLFRSLSYRLRTGLLITVLYLVGIWGLIESNQSIEGPLLLVLFAFISTILMGGRAGLLTGVMSTGSLAVTDMLVRTDGISLAALQTMTISGDSTGWIFRIIIFASIVLFAVFSLNVLTTALGQTITAQKQAASDLHREQDRLQERIFQRTADVENRIAQYEIANRLAHDFSTATGLDELLNHAANWISSQFGFYHTGIFLMDDRSEYATLKSASGAAGQALLRTAYRLKAGEEGAVGDAISNREMQVTPDVTSDPFYFKNPLLPDTRSELALPLCTGEIVIGALDIQSTTPNAFLQEDIHILQTIADQLSIAIEKARLIESLERSLTEIRESYQEQVHQVWRFHLTDTRKKHAYRFKQSKLEANIPESSYVRQAYSSGQMVINSQVKSESGDIGSVVTIPILIREQVIGAMEIQLEYKQVPEDMIALLQATTHRMAIALENARLLEAIKIRAEREHMISDISARVRSETDIDSILKTAASELGRTLGISEVLVQLRSEKL